METAVMKTKLEKIKIQFIFCIFIRNDEDIKKSKGGAN